MPNLLADLSVVLSAGAGAGAVVGAVAAASPRWSDNERRRVSFGAIGLDAASFIIGFGVRDWKLVSRRIGRVGVMIDVELDPEKSVDINHKVAIISGARLEFVYLPWVDIFRPVVVPPSDLGVLVIRSFRRFSFIGDTDSLIIIMGATRFIGTTARIGAVDRPANDSLTRIFKLRTSGGACGFFMMLYDDFTLDGESFVAVVVEPANDRRFADTAALRGIDKLDEVIGLAVRLDFGEGGRTLGVGSGPWRDRRRRIVVDGFGGAGACSKLLGRVIHPKELRRVSAGRRTGVWLWLMGCCWRG